MSESRRATLRQAFERWNAGDLEAGLERATDDVRWYPTTRRSATRSWWARVRGEQLCWFHGYASYEQALEATRRDA